MTKKFTFKHQPESWGGAAGTIEADLFADLIVDALEKEFPEVEFEQVSAPGPNTLDSDNDDQELLETINNWIEDNWSNVINNKADQLFKDLVKLVLHNVESGVWDQWYEYYRSQSDSGSHVYAQNKMQGWDSGVQVLFTDDPELPKDLKDRYFVDKGLNALIGVGDHWDNIPSCATEAEIRDTLLDFYVLPDYDND